MKLDTEEGRTVFLTLKHQFKQIARARVLAVAIVGLVAFISSALVSLNVRPEPCIHDEFSYLLAADTFAHGRLANPPHPLYRSFETFHVLQHPNYVSKYQPGQGLFLAAGQVLTGHPIVGAWLSVSLACAAICWMLQAWVPAEWAFLGGLLAVGRLCIEGSFCTSYSYWSNGFMGGGVPALGGALVFGAVRRLESRASVPDAVILGLGLVLLAISRPIEGCTAVFLCLLYLALVLLRKNSWQATFLRLIPSAVTLAIGAACMLYYNYKTTGSPLMLPYVIYEQEYSSIPLFLWQPLRPPLQIGNEQMASFNSAINITEFYSSQHSLPGFLLQLIIKLFRIWDFFLGEWLVIPFLIGCFAKTSKPWINVALGSIAIELLLVLSLVWFSPHYIAPVTALIFLCIVQGLRKLNQIRWSKHRGLTLALILTGFVVSIPAYFAENHSNAQMWYRRKAEIIRQLKHEPGTHLVLVRYGPHHTPYYEWVSNGADIDQSKVVWARSIDEQQNKKLMDYFKDRHLWVLEDDTQLLQPCKATLTRIR